MSVSMLEASVLLVFVAGLLFCLIAGLPILLAILFGYLVFFAYGAFPGEAGPPVCWRHRLPASGR